MIFFFLFLLNESWNRTDNVWYLVIVSRESDIYWEEKREMIYTYIINHLQKNNNNNIFFSIININIFE